MTLRVHIGDLYPDGPGRQQNPESEPFHTVLSRGFNGTVCDVYGKTKEEAKAAAQFICDAINALNYMEWWMASSDRANVRDGSLTAMVLDGMTLVDAIRKEANPCPACGDWHTIEMDGKDGKGYRMCQECDHTWR